MILKRKSTVNEEVLKEEEQVLNEPEIIEEPKEDVSVEIETPVEEQPIEPIQETPTVEDDVKENAFKSLLTTAVQKYWDIINELNSIIASFDFDYDKENKEDIKNILSQLIDDTTINIGMLYKIQNLISYETSELIDQGLQKAEEIIEK